jgi:hypothetical protein
MADTSTDHGGLEDRRVSGARTPLSGMKYSRHLLQLDGHDVVVCSSAEWLHRNSEAVPTYRP